ncbi:MAG: hypothetical protein K8T91_21380 [Planctomycetes bacterium]|nr:hypothetical protein [Planctomycetota bacterium]
MNVLESGAAWLGEQLKPAAGRTIDIHQGSRILSDVVATPVEETYEVVDELGQRTSVVMMDWTIVASDLGDVMLRKGAEIHETLGGVRKVYEVLPVGDREAVENLDTAGILLTVHTKQIG